MIRWVILTVVVAALDQLSKLAITRSIAYGSGIEIAPFFNLVHVHNKGAAFSFLSNASGWQREFFIAIAVIAIVWVIFLLRRHARETLFCFALSLILAGAVGNVIDRIWLGAVIDFLDFHVAGYHFPAFNVADSAITCGAAILIVDSFRRKPEGA
jgi:signal peptidase II